MLLGGNTSSVNAMLAHYPDLAADKLLHVDMEAFLTAYDRLYRRVLMESQCRRNDDYMVAARQPSGDPHGLPPAQVGARSTLECWRLFGCLWQRCMHLRGLAVLTIGAAFWRFVGFDSSFRTSSYATKHASEPSQEICIGPPQAASALPKPLTSRRVCDYEF